MDAPKVFFAKKGVKRLETIVITVLLSLLYHNYDSFALSGRLEFLFFLVNCERFAGYTMYVYLVSTTESDDTATIRILYEVVNVERAAVSHLDVGRGVTTV